MSRVVLTTLVGPEAVRPLVDWILPCVDGCGASEVSGGRTRVQPPLERSLGEGTGG